MSSYLEKIGLVAWGCKGGYKPCLFSNNVVSVQDEDIAQTVLDIRKYVRYLRPNVDFFALEFTSKYKVFTKYRSSNDSGDGAFVAITVYVPHELQYKGIRLILDELMTAYWREYMDVGDGKHLQGKYYDISKLQVVLNSHSSDIVPETGRYKKGRSKRTEIPQLLLYEKVESVDLYFSTPYREVFRDSQEITFLSKESLDPHNADDYRPVVADYLHILNTEEIGDQEPESILLPFDVDGVTLERFIVDGEDLLAFVKTQGIPLAEGQIMEIELSKQYYENYYCRLTTEKAIEQGILVVSGRNYRFSEKIPFEEKKKIVVVQSKNSSFDASFLRDLLILEGSNGKQIPLNYEDKALSMSFSGSAVDSEQVLRVLHLKNSTKSEVLAKFIPSQVTEVIVDVTEVVIEVSKASIIEGQIEIVVKCSFGEEVPPIALKYKDTKACRFYLPTHLADVAQYSFDVSRHNYSFDRDRLMLTLEPTLARVNVDSSDLDDHVNLSSISFELNIDNEVYKSCYNTREKSLYFVLPYHWQKMKLGNLAQSGGFPIKYEIGRKVLVIKGIALINQCESTQSFSLKSANIEEMDFDHVLIEAGQCIIIPTTYSIIEEPASSYLIVQKGKDKNFTYFVLKPIVSDQIVGSKEFDDNNLTNSTAEREIKGRSPITLYLHHCDSFYFKDSKKGLVKIDKLDVAPTFRENCRIFENLLIDSFRVRDKHGNELCLVVFPQDAYEKNEEIVKENSENGFRVEWAGQFCHVYYEPSVGLKVKSIMRRIGKDFGKILFFLLPIILLSGLGYYWFQNSDKQLKVTFTGDVKKICIDPMENRGLHYIIEEETILVITDSLGIHDIPIQLFFDKETVKYDSIYTLSVRQIKSLWTSNGSDVTIPITKSKEKGIGYAYTDQDKVKDEKLKKEAETILQNVYSRDTYITKKTGDKGGKQKFEAIVAEIKDTVMKHRLYEVNRVFTAFFVDSDKKRGIVTNIEQFNSINKEFKEIGYKYLSEEYRQKYDKTYGVESEIKGLRQFYPYVDLKLNLNESDRKKAIEEEKKVNKTTDGVNTRNINKKEYQLAKEKISKRNKK